MTGSPFSNVLAQPGTDTSSETAARPVDTPGEPAPGVETDAAGTTHVAGQDETPGDASSGAPGYAT